VPYTGGCYANYNPNFHGNPRINGSYGSGNPKGAAATSYINVNAFENPASFTFGDSPRTAPAGSSNPFTTQFAVCKHTSSSNGSDMRRFLAAE
jgi:hypothetical protein